MNTHIRNPMRTIREVVTTHRAKCKSSRSLNFFPMQYVQLFTRPHCSSLVSVKEFTKMEEGACTPCLLEWHEE